MNSQAPEPEVLPRSVAMKFAYASGARPLPGYTIKRGVGRGGFGEVYYAVSDAGKEAAIKLIRHNLDVELRGVTQCLNLKHPHLLALYDVKHDDDGNCWVIMEYVAGESLEDALARSPNGLPAHDVVEWMHGIAAGVAYLHDRGIVHRDLKPGNIFNDEGVVKLGDYGLSKFISCSRRSGQTESIGTVHYMAPEVANGRYGKEIDIYALGIILYEMLTGRVPFEGESVGEVLMKHLTAEPNVASLDEPFRDLVKRALAKDPTLRFGRVEELIAALPAATSPPAFHSMRGAGPALLPGMNRPAADAHSHSPLPGRDDEEPVWRWLRTTFGGLATRWHNVQLATPIKVLIAVAAVIVALRTANRILPLLIWATVFYLIYRLLRAIWRRSMFARHRRRGPAHQPRMHGRRAAVQPVASLANGALPAVSGKPPRERLAESLGSLLIAALASMVISLVMVLLRGQPPQTEQYAWLALVSTLGAWGILIPASFWERDRGEPAMRRFVMLVAGLGLGALAWAVHAGLRVDLPFEIVIRPVDDTHIPKSFYGSDGAPLLNAFLAYFGFLFLLVRWWRAADPARQARLSLWATMSAMFVAWLLNFVWPFPQPWGFMVTATVSIAVQLASPWNPARPPSFRTANNI